MPLMDVREYRNTCFTKNSRPTIGTVKKWIADGSIYGKKIGCKYYIDPDITVIMPVDPLVKKILLDDGQKKKSK